jgi:hypothetical protein
MLRGLSFLSDYRRAQRFRALQCHGLIIRYDGSVGLVLNNRCFESPTDLELCLY